MLNQYAFTDAVSICNNCSTKPVSLPQGHNASCQRENFICLLCLCNILRLTLIVGKRTFLEEIVRLIAFQSDIAEHYHSENYLLPSGLRPRSRKRSRTLVSNRRVDFLNPRLTPCGTNRVPVKSRGLSFRYSSASIISTWRTGRFPESVGGNWNLITILRNTSRR